MIQDGFLMSADYCGAGIDGVGLPAVGFLAHGGWGRPPGALSCVWSVTPFVGGCPLRMKVKTTATTTTTRATTNTIGLICIFISLYLRPKSRAGCHHRSTDSRHNDIWVAWCSLVCR